MTLTGVNDVDGVGMVMAYAGWGGDGDMCGDRAGLGKFHGWGWGFKFIAVSILVTMTMPIMTRATTVTDVIQ